MRRSPLPVILTSVVLLLTLLAAFLGIREFNNQTTFALDRRESIAKLAAMLVHEKFDGIVDVGISLASRPLVYRNVEKGDWDEALEVIEGVPEAFPSIDGVALLDTEGVLKAVAPSMPVLIGKDFSYRDYYQGVSKEWKPYVSEAFKRAVDPKYNVVSVAVPIKSPDEKVLGILLLAIKLDTIIDWASNIDVGSGGFIFVVDRKGKLISNNGTKPGDDLVNYSSLPEIQKVLRGEGGVGVHGADPIIGEKHVAASAFVEDYGLGVMVIQPARLAFVYREQQAIEYALFWTAIILGAGLFLYRILKDREMIRIQHDRETVFLNSIGDGVVAIDRNWNITLLNKAASVITGWSKEEALGKSFCTVVKFIRERDRAEDVSFIEDAMVRKHAVSMVDNTLLIRKDGNEVPVGDSAAPVVGADGEIRGAIIVFRDTSIAREKSRLRSDLAYSAHQLRTPITEALWNLEIAMDEQDPDKRKETTFSSFINPSSISKNFQRISLLFPR